MTDKARILFVDDEQRVLNAMRGLFRREFELFLTTEGAEAVRIAERESIDVLVADQRMPGMTGVEVLGQVKAVSPHTVRILLTGYADLDAIEGSINVGEVFRFLSKPCPPPLLRETLTQAVSTARASAAAAITAAAAAKAAPAAAAASPVVETAHRPAHSGPEAVSGSQIIPTLAAEPPSADDATPDGGFNTEIVMSGDSASEAETTAGGSKDVVSDIGIAVFSIDPTFAETTVRALSPKREVSLATNLARVLDVLEQQRAGVLITDYTDNVNQLRNMIGSLKQVLPELVTIVVSENRDASDMIALINYGQVFRYVDKPLDMPRFLNDVNAATLKHVELLEHPELLQRHAVVEQPAADGGDTGFIQFVGRIKQLGNPWRRIDR
ncbi:MAG: response regulator [Pseudomonadota bacterium]